MSPGGALACLTARRYRDIIMSPCATDDFLDASGGQHGSGRICRTRRYGCIIADDSDENENYLIVS